MATGCTTVESFWGKISRDHLECAICADNFKDPKVLDCLHTFCLKCLREIRIRQDPENKKLICPICRKETNLEKIEVDDLPHNFTIDALVDELHLHQKLLGTEGEEPSCVTCQSCEEDQTAVSRCSDCDHFLCQDCQLAHGRLAVTRSHTTYSLDQFRSGEIVYKSKLREHIPKCQKHLDQSLSIYCTTCEQMTCTTCSVLNHAKHTLVGIPEAYDSFKQQVAKLVSKVKKKIEEFKNATEKANVLQKKLDSSFAETTGKISKKADSEVGKVKDEEQKLTQEAKKVYKERSETFITSTAKNCQEQAHLEKKLADVCNLMTETNCYEVLDLKQKVLFNLKELTAKKATVTAEHLSPFDFVEEEGSFFGELVLKAQTVVPLTLAQWTAIREEPVLAILKQLSLQTCVKQGRWVLKTEVSGQFSNVNCVGVFSNNIVVALDYGLKTLATFFPTTNTSKRRFQVALQNVPFKGLTVTRNDKLIALLENNSVNVYGDDLCVKFTAGTRLNINPIGIAVSKDSTIAVSYDTGKISLHKPDGFFIKILKAPGVGRYLTFYNNQVIYTMHRHPFQRLISIDCSTGKKVFIVDIKDDDDKNNPRFEPTGLCCDLDGSIYVASQKSTGKIRHFSPTGQNLELALKGCGRAQNIAITPGGELVVATGNRVKIYHRL